jgi:Uma2 family endonuclease
MSSIQTTTGVLDPAAPPPVTSQVPDDRMRESGERRFLIRGIDWATYRKISDALAERHYHMSFDGKDLELMTISKGHGGFSRLLALMVFILTEETGMPHESCGDMTLERNDLKQGIEPDECFYLTNEPRVRGKQQIDLAVDPPPDLGVEIDLTTDSRRRLGIYAQIRVPEIWRYDGKEATIYQLQADGQYTIAERSRFFSFLSAADLSRFLARRNESDESMLLRSFREWVREQIKQRG